MACWVSKKDKQEVPFLKNVCKEKSVNTTFNIGYGFYLDEQLTGLDELGGDHVSPLLRAVLHPAEQLVTMIAS